MAKAKPKIKPKGKPKAWELYQESAAHFFRGLGFDAKVNELVEGARGKHAVDVFVKGSVHGLAFQWVVECKCWKTNVPKEKVLALAEIVQDVGADRGILLSETGFQAGAVRQTFRTNITLTSISDLKEETAEHLEQAVLSNLTYRIVRAKRRLREITRTQCNGHYQPPVVAFLAGLMDAESIIHEALAGVYPVLVYGDPGELVFARDFTHLIQIVERKIALAEQWEMPEADGAAGVTLLG